MNTAQEQLRKQGLTVDEYHRLGDEGFFARDERVELIEGEIVAMAPIGWEHVDIVNDLNKLLVFSCGDLAVVSVQNPVVLPDDSEPEPDIAVFWPRVPGSTGALPQAEQVLLVVEVADSSLRYDRDRKIPLYARRGIPEVWLIDVQGRELTRFHSPGGQGYRSVGVPDLSQPLTLQQCSAIRVDLSGVAGIDGQ